LARRDVADLDPPTGLGDHVAWLFTGMTSLAAVVRLPLR
jgi:hypothetical protein